MASYTKSCYNLFLCFVFSFSSCYGFTIINPLDTTVFVQLRVDKKEIAALDVPQHSYSTLPTLNNVPALNITYQALGSLVPTLLNPLQFLTSLGWLLNMPTSAKLQPANYEKTTMITPEFNLMLTDNGPRLIGPHLKKALALKAVALRTALQKTRTKSS